MKLEKENAMKKFKKMLAAILATATVATTLSTATLVSGNTESDKFNIFGMPEKYPTNLWPRRVKSPRRTGKTTIFPASL